MRTRRQETKAVEVRKDRSEKFLGFSHALQLTTLEWLHGDMPALCKVRRLSKAGRLAFEEHGVPDYSAKLGGLGLLKRWTEKLGIGKGLKSVNLD